MSWSDPLLNLLKNKDTFFNGPGKGPVYDYPNPIPPRRSIDLWTWLNSVNLNLLNQDKFFTGAGKGPNYDWPNPQLPRRVIDLWTWVQSTTIDQRLSANVPKNQYDYPNPMAPRRAIELWNWVEPVNLNLRSQDLFFGPAGKAPNYDYPNPIPKGFSNEFRTWAFGLNLDLLSINFKPFNQSDYPNPPGYRRPIDNYTWLDRFELPLISTDTFFGAQGETKTYDWPNPIPKRYGIDLISWIQGIDLSNYFANVLPPFYLTDWPNPM